MKKTIPLFLLVVLSAAACRQRHSSELLKEINNSQQRTAQQLRNATKISISAMYETNRNNWGGRSAGLFREKVEKANILFKSIDQYLDTAISQVQKYPNRKVEEGILRTEAGKWYNRLIVFQDSLTGMLKTDSFHRWPIEKMVRDDSIRYVNNMSACLHLIDSGKTTFIGQEEWVAKTFSAVTSALEVEITLQKIQNDLLALQNNVIEDACLNIRPGCNLYYTVTTSLAFIEKQRFKAGEKVLLQAGVTTFSGLADAKLQVKDTTVKIEKLPQEGEYSFVAKGKPGTHRLPLQLQFTKPDGTVDSLTKIITYTIE